MTSHLLLFTSICFPYNTRQERNKAQLDSFVDEEDQWQSLEEDERDFLRSKDIIIQKMEVLAEQLVMLFIGQKMRNG